MDKKYQVFVSSTFRDLQEERQHVIQALLELDCIPAGMELFPAADEDQWTLITEVIDDCDYYIVVIAGRYGSLASDGMGYTEKEYRYALEQGKPVMAFLYKDPECLPGAKLEKSQKMRKKLDEFRKLVQRKMCKFWVTPDELGLVVSSSLVKLTKRHPGIGWVRGDRLPSENVEKEIVRLRRRVEELEAELENTARRPPVGSEALLQGEDQIRIRFELSVGPRGRRWVDKTNQDDYEIESTVTWNGVFACVAPLMIDESQEVSLRRPIEKHAKEAQRKKIANLAGAREVYDLRISNEDFQTILIQFRALGLITQSVKKRSLRDTYTYWKLTKYGDALMTNLRALRKS